MMRLHRKGRQSAAIIYNTLAGLYFRKQLFVLPTYVIHINGCLHFPFQNKENNTIIYVRLQSYIGEMATFGRFVTYYHLEGVNEVVVNQLRR